MKKVCMHCGNIDETEITEDIKSSGFEAQIKKKTLQELSFWLNKTRERIFEDTYKDKKPRLIRLKKEIEQEFVIRKEKGEEPMDLPEIGMLSVMGYHVGVTKGKTDEVRIDIMKSIIKGPLPFVGSIQYMNEWGKDKKERFRKLRNVLWGLRAKSSTEMEEAIKDWTHDIEWLDSNKDGLIEADELPNSWVCPGCDRVN